MIKLGFVSAIFPDLDLNEVLAFARQERFACVELMCWPKGKAERRYAGVSHIDVDFTAQRRPEEILDLAERYGVKISGLGYYPNPLDPDEGRATVQREHLKSVINAAARLGVPIVNTFVGRNPAQSLEESFRAFRAVWPDLVRFAEDHGVKVAIENCPMLFSQDEWPGGKNLAHSPANWRRMFDCIPSPSFGLNYDPSHFVWQHMDYVKPVYEFADRIFHVHLKDAKVRRDKLDEVGILATPLEYHTPKLPGLGDVDWARFLSALTDVRYEGPACVEVEDRAFEADQDSRKAALRLSRDFLRQFLCV